MPRSYGGSYGSGGARSSMAAGLVSLGGLRRWRLARFARRRARLRSYDQWPLRKLRLVQYRCSPRAGRAGRAGEGVLTLSLPLDTSTAGVYSFGVRRPRRPTNHKARSFERDHRIGLAPSSVFCFSHHVNALVSFLRRHQSEQQPPLPLLQPTDPNQPELPLFSPDAPTANVERLRSHGLHRPSSLLPDSL